ncbi:MAG: diguanylate cyclase, partial [Planctomycetes bacterium]|nr:diguanylate cyclase [Planctomycetota bacterium]
LMTAEVASCAAGTPMSEIQRMMIERSIRHLPIVDDGVAVAMVSSRDVMNYQLDVVRATRAAAEDVAKLSMYFRSLDFESLLDTVVREIPKVFGAGRAFFYLSGDEAKANETARLVRHECRGDDCVVKLRGDMVAERSGEAMLLCDTVPEACEGLYGQSQSIIIPIDVTGAGGQQGATASSLRGFLCMCGIDLSSAQFRELALYKGTLVREILQAVVSNAKIYKEMLHDRLTDPLTGVATRGFFEEKLAAECERSSRYNRPFCLAIVDADEFKTVNDELGHDMGDQVLIQIGECMTKAKRGTDVLGRYGGDEFVLLMPETRLDDAISLLDRIRSRVEQIPMPDGFGVSLSCGVAQQWHEQQEGPKELFRRADQAMYEAKKAGRNCTKGSHDFGDCRNVGDFSNDKTIVELQEQIDGLSSQSKDLFAQSLWGLVRAIEARDPYTKSHSENVMKYAVGIAETLEIDPDDIDVIRRAALIHDIGMIGVPDAILRKPGKMTAEERDIVQQHPRMGVHILRQMRSLEREVPIVRHHHERWDGCGYPSALSGTRIPLGARILAVADTLDAITSNRSHRRSRTLREAMKIIRDSASAQLDPTIVDALVKWVERVQRQRGEGLEITAQDMLDSQDACVL